MEHKWNINLKRVELSSFWDKYNLLSNNRNVRGRSLFNPSVSGVLQGHTYLGLSKYLWPFVDTRK